MTMPDNPSLFASENDFWVAVVSLVPLFIISLIFCFGVGIIAKTRGRSFWGWSLLSLLITPIVAGLVVFVMKELPSGRRLPPPM
jgi:predicted branched-subunit amino acid permease